MSAPHLRAYRVTLINWGCQTVTLEAESAAAAERLAMELWQTDSEAFSYRDGGIDNVFADEVPA